MTEIRDWLDGLGMGQYADAFEANAVYCAPRPEIVAPCSDGQFAVSDIWDKTMRSWDLNNGNTSPRRVRGSFNCVCGSDW